MLQGLLKPVRRRIGFWFDHLAPRGCALCDQALAPGAFPGVCMACILAMPGINRLRCARCGLPASAVTDQQACPCSTASPAFAEQRLGELAGAHFMEHYRNPGTCRLPGGFGARQAGADDVNWMCHDSLVSRQAVG